MLRLCIKCRTHKEPVNFHKGNNAGGLRLWCKECVGAYKKEYTQKNAARIRAQQKVYGEKMKEVRRGYYRARYLEKRETLLQQGKEYRLKNPHTHAQREAKRRSVRLQRTPVWLAPDDFWMMEQAYELAALRTRLFGFAWHVDHKIPLQGKRVSGLHAPLNLQVLPGLENMRKNNQYEVV